MCNETYRPSVVTFRLNPLLNQTQDHFVILPVPTWRLSRYLTSFKNIHSFNPNDVGTRAGLFLHARSVLAQLNTLPILCSLQKMRKPQRHTLPTTLGKKSEIPNQRKMLFVQLLITIQNRSGQIFNSDHECIEVK